MSDYTDKLGEIIKAVETARLSINSVSRELHNPDNVFPLFNNTGRFQGQRSHSVMNGLIRDINILLTDLNDHKNFVNNTNKYSKDTK